MNKLELTWFGKENNSSIEPRLLIEKQSLSYSSKNDTIVDNGTYDNMLIHGDNLLALRALEKDYSGKIKCIYIDPPYNTGAAFEHYDDNLEHSIWLSLMRDRLIILQKLLSPSGAIFVQIDDNEMAYLKVLMDEIFDRKNFVSTISVKMSTVSGVKTTHREKTIVKEKEYILVYSKDISCFSIKPQYVPVSNIDKEFQYYLEKKDDNPDHWEVKRLKDVLSEKGLISDITKIDFNSKDVQMKKTVKFIIDNKDKIWRRAFIRNEYKKLSQENPNKIFVNLTDNKTHYYYRGREMFFLSDKFHECLTPEGIIEAPSNLLADIWNDINTGVLFNEGGVEFRNSKKPEFLISRIINMATNVGDLVLDSFLGSGTTAAVAHKMKRKWIGIEMGEHAFTHCKVRLDNVINGIDSAGVTKVFDWNGGGGYKFYELAPTLINHDALGEPIINKEYNADMLASAVAIHEGFKFNPDSLIFWKQSKANENSYLFVTTKHITDFIVKEITSQMSEDEFLIIACKSFDKSASKISDKIKIKKIPQMLLGKCEFGKDDYSLNIINPPVYEDEEDDGNE